jgi:predicted alpha/beta superfamily hydrolase
VRDPHASTGQNVILVGVDNGGPRRADEYSPFEDEIFGGGGADEYVRFLTDTLKPRIDELFPVSRHPEDTAILGSSLGGLFALYAKFARPDVFGAAVVCSPAVSFANSSLGRFVGRQAASGRIHLDVGTTEFGTGSPEYVRRVRALGQTLVEIGYEPGSTLNYVEVPGGTHCERSWGTRLPSGLSFALGRTRRGRDSRLQPQYLVQPTGLEPIARALWVD